MSQGSASDYSQAYSNLIRGKRFTRTINDGAAKIFLKRIYDDNGPDKLKLALNAFKAHLEYYEPLRKTNRKTSWDIYHEFLKLLEQNKNVFVRNPDEIPQDQKLLEGFANQVLVNSFERNPKARKKCLDY